MSNLSNSLFIELAADFYMNSISCIMAASRDIPFGTPRGQLFRDKRINPEKKNKNKKNVSKFTATNR